MNFAVPGAVAAPLTDSGFSRVSHLRKFALVALAIAFAATLLAFAPAAPAAAAGTQASHIVATAKTHLGKPWVLGATGLRTFDCSGLMYRVYLQNDLLAKIGGRRRTARGYWAWFRDRGMASRTNLRVGDLIIWGSGKHIGLYVGDGMAISALTSGVKRHRVHGLTSSVTTYLHVKINR